jgi:hypothetical protein
VDLKATDPVAGWTNTETIELTAAHQENVFTVRAGLDSRVLFERRVRYLDTHGAETTVDWDDADAGVLVVRDPLPDIIDLQILGSARFGSVVRRLIVELRPKAAPQQVTTIILTADKPSDTWSWPVDSGGNRAYEYRVTLFTANNEVKKGEWLDGTPGTLVVGEGIARIRQVEMIFVGASLASLKLLGLKIRFSFDDKQSGLFAEDEFLVQDTSKSLKWTYPVADPARQEFTYQITSIAQDGSMHDAQPVATSSLLIVRPLPVQ